MPIFNKLKRIYSARGGISLIASGLHRGKSLNNSLQMLSIFHLKLAFWLATVLGVGYFVYIKRDQLAFECREIKTRIGKLFGRRIALNDSFAEDVESGFHSQNFDIRSENGEDSRSGLDNAAKAEIRRIMNNENLTFDKARLRYTERQFGKNLIAPDGTPLDPKAVTFSK
ncbi:uncharacterized protein KNAG_0H01720 [Huiozyma naganishii CBS 8797]|uniref:Uncharacterized protein n=1 Tax=Huiozyma naganishii (strain ATCC MYA-139 / BCRC 22969 / CBS 8797 / KCTC 17520 / NBRC 10181 / NCYC 3082 / Yp74L-3) TaxID=1071383 RepID=J7S1R3_HUIN7|nr:hypothetical protein KNAG_0H01720 [Kazachstania naganishii CBS 8797]CCK71587.1 hypothetical protein KNAG_0H01720 [Kazachstania naganishii CBS 8797]